MSSEATVKETEISSHQQPSSKTIDSKNIKDPVVGFIFNSKGLMYNLTLEGSKITKINKD